VAGAHPTPLPGPGTYARHNAVDFPALLPDGTPAALSVSPAVSGRPGTREAVSEALLEAGELPASPGHPGPPIPPDDAGQGTNGNGQEGARS